MNYWVKILPGCLRQGLICRMHSPIPHIHLSKKIEVSDKYAIVLHKQYIKCFKFKISKKIESYVIAGSCGEFLKLCKLYCLIQCQLL